MGLGLLVAAGEASGFWGAKHEPQDGQIYHGAQAEVRPASIFSYHVDWKGIEDYTEAAGNRPKLIMHYISFDWAGFRLLKPTVAEIGRKVHDYIPQIGLDFYSYAPGFNVLNPKDITEKIASGDYDGKIQELARIFVAMDSPAFLRPGYEFGGSGQGKFASKGFWISAWKRIYRIFKDEGASKVAFVWNTLDAPDYLDYYPGDDFVDWWAVNVFSNFAHEEEFINRFIRNAGERAKPVMIAESTPRYIGSIGGGEAWRQWYDPYFNLVRKYSHIKAFCYINASWDNYPDKTFRFDCRIQAHPVVAWKYRAILSSPQYIHAGTK
jgi:hypothetical protein